MPLVRAGEDPDPERPAGPVADEARKIQSRYARGELVRVAVGRNLAEAELIKGVLLEQGIPSMLRRTRGFDVPDFLAAGPRDVLVPESAAELAHELLDQPPAEAGAGDEPPPGPARGLAVKGVAALLAALLLFGALAGAILLLAR
jgi:hypothetical protein